MKMLQNNEESADIARKSPDCSFETGDAWVAQEFQAATEQLRSKLQNLRREYEDARKEAITLAREEVASYDGALNLLENLMVLSNSALAAKLRKILEKKKGARGSGATPTGDFNFDRLVYYVNQVNSLTVPAAVVQKNPRFCETVLTTIAEEYVRINAYLTDQRTKVAAEQKTMENQLEKEYREKATAEWTVFCEWELQRLASSECSETVERILASI